MMPVPITPDPATQRPRLEKVYREHFALVWRTLRRWGLDAAEAEDAAQDVFLVVHRRLPDFDPNRSMRAWLFGIARRVASDRRRSGARTQRRLRLVGTTEFQDPGPESKASDADTLAIIERVLAPLDDDWRAMFILIELEGVSPQEVADQLDVPRNTIYTRQKILRRRIAQALELAQRGRAS